MALVCCAVANLSTQTVPQIPHNVLIISTSSSATASLLAC